MYLPRVPVNCGMFLFSCCCFIHFFLEVWVERWEGLSRSKRKQIRLWTQLDIPALLSLWQWLTWDMHVYLWWWFCVFFLSFFFFYFFPPVPLKISKRRGPWMWGCSPCFRHLPSRSDGDPLFLPTRQLAQLVLLKVSSCCAVLLVQSGSGSSGVK